jgi:hypothetical protein
VSGYIDPGILDIGTSELHAPAAVPSRKRSRYPLDMRLVGPRIGLEDVESRKILPVPGIELRLLCHAALNYSSGSYLLCLNNLSTSEFSSEFILMLKFTA